MIVGMANKPYISQFSGKNGAYAISSEIWTAEGGRQKIYIFHQDT